MHLHASLFYSLEDLAPYAERWNELVQGSPGNSIFLTWEWLSTWQVHVSKEIPLFVIAVFDDSANLQAVLPLYQSTFELFGCISYKCLRPMGDCHCGGEYPDLIISPYVDIKETILCIQGCLEEHQKQWDCLYFPYVSGWTDAAARLAAILRPEDSAFIRQRESIFSSILLPKTTEEYDRDILGSLSSLIRRQTRKLEQLGKVTISLCQKEHELPFYLEHLFSLHKKRWEALGQQGSFIRRPLMPDFYTAFAATALQKGWLKMFALQLNGKPYAVQIGYFYNGVFYQMQEGFDPAGPGGLGNVLRYAVITWCIANEVSEYDYLGGDEEHKLKWGAKQRRGFHLFSGAKNSKNFLLALADIWPTGRFIAVGPPASYGRSHD